MIRLSTIEKVYRTAKIETIALKDVNLHIKRGEFLSIMGPSGCGKSTMLNIMGLLDQPSQGIVEIDSEHVAKFSDRKLARLRNTMIGFVFQSYHLINDLSVVDNVEIPLLYRSISGSSRRKLALEALDKVGLNARTRHFPSQLSGGQRQRVAIARAIVGSPQIILADEPTGNLDSVMGAEIMDILNKLNQEEQTTIVMVTHDEILASQTQRIIRLFDGSQVN
jgi:putative ABC transport system ATP-binding protein